MWNAIHMGVVPVCYRCTTLTTWEHYRCTTVALRSVHRRTTVSRYTVVLPSAAVETTGRELPESQFSRFETMNPPEKWSRIAILRNMLWYSDVRHANLGSSWVGVGVTETMALSYALNQKALAGVTSL